mgnify:CR=1 FL=1
MTVPANPKLYHILHHDRLPEIIRHGFLFSDAEVRRVALPGTSIGYENIKQRRLTNLLESHDGLAVGSCVPFYLCPRSIMLFVVHKRNAGLGYAGGQAPIITLEFDLHAVRADAEANNRRWAFTTSGAGAYAFADYADINDLEKIRWDLLGEKYWGANADAKTAKQSEFLVEQAVPWSCVSRIGVFDNTVGAEVTRVIAGAAHRPIVQVIRAWYY